MTTESGLKRFWNAIKPPPAAPRRPSEGSSISPKQRLRRKRLVVGIAMVVLAGVGAWGVDSYLAAAPTRADAAFQEGIRLMALGKYADALNRFTKATNTWPALAAGYFERGLARVRLREPDPAMKDFEQALNLDPNLTEAHTELGSIYRQRGDMNRAMSEFTVAINLGSAVEANYQRGQIYESLGEHQKALEDYNLAIGGRPDAPFVYRARALTRENLGDQAGAEDDRQKADSMERPFASK